MVEWTGRAAGTQWPGAKPMTLSQVERRLEALEKQVGDLRDALEYQQAVEGIRRGLESADREKGEGAAAAFARIRRKYRRTKR